VKKTSEHAILPVRGSAGAAGYDLARSRPIVIIPFSNLAHKSNPTTPHCAALCRAPMCFIVSLYSAVEAVVPARGKALLSTDLSIAIPSGYYGRVAPRSGLAWKNSIDVGAGVIGMWNPAPSVKLASSHLQCHARGG
jgi:dUTPase